MGFAYVLYAVLCANSPPCCIFCAIIPIFCRVAIYIYIFFIYTPNLGLQITLPGREREQGCFKGSTEGARGPARAKLTGA